MIGCFTLFFLLGIVPCILGIPWTKEIKPRYSLAFSYSIGYFMELALFHLIAIPIIFSYGRFHLISILYSVCLIISCVGCLIYANKEKLFPKKNRIKALNKLHWHEWILLVAFIVFVGIQVIRGFIYDITYMSHDDAIYTTIAADTLEIDQVAIVGEDTGVAGMLNITRAIQTSLVFPSYLSIVSGIPVTTIEHTVQYIQLILLAYITYVYLVGELISKRDNQLIFLVIVALFYWFGYHSHYSLTFRLLGPNYQGKAVLAVSLTPLILTILVRILSEPYNWKIGICLFLLSMAAVSLTLWGTGTIVVIVTIPVILSLFCKERKWKHILYIPWSYLSPAIFVGVYLIYKYAI